MTPYKPVSPYKTRLDSHNAYHMALCAEAVYKTTDAEILACLKEVDDGYLSATRVQVHGTEAAFIEHEEYVVYAFTGTNEIGDWLTNIRAFPDDWIGGQYHRGFAESFQAIWPELEKVYWMKRRQKKRPVFITGHSLGGALATCCAALFNDEDWPYMGLYTFGSPRCVGKHAARVFNIESKDKTFRFQNSSDIVTRMPSRAMGYRHTGQNMFIDGDGVIQTDPGTWARFVDFVSVSVNDVLNVELSTIGDHDMPKYRNHIDNWDIEL